MEWALVESGVQRIGELIFCPLPPPPCHRAFSAVNKPGGLPMRDYQLAALNWLIQLHDQGLNGILADGQTERLAESSAPRSARASASWTRLQPSAGRMLTRCFIVSSL